MAHSIQNFVGRRYDHHRHGQHQKIMGGFTYPASTSHTRRPTPQQVRCHSASARGGGRHYPLTLDTTLCAPRSPPRRPSHKHSRLEHACAERFFLLSQLVMLASLSNNDKRIGWPGDNVQILIELLCKERLWIGPPRYWMDQKSIRFR